ncbi:uncharacterized protein [Lolium perenne]|uniref:uncharacterized protein n=1 Tax=Lolium perenne TaxID=4522 RepID=UPI0021F610DB|nr:uncharacterized protein LOC127330640 [Lolium perenne]
MIENQAPRNVDFQLKSILKSLKQIHAMLLNEVSPTISTSGLEIEEAMGMEGEAKGRDEVLPTSAKTKLELLGREANMHKVLTEEESFDRYRRGWVSNWSALHGTFTEMTTLSSMHFTHSTPGDTPFAAFVSSTLQIYSIKVAEIKDALELQWPLRVFGVVAARDTVDRNRNILFSRRRDDYQELNQHDPFLRLTGPSRAIVAEEPVHVEIELKVKGRTKSEDRVLMSRVWYYSDRLCTLYTPLAGKFCTLVLSSEELENSVQATIVGIRVTEGTPWPFEYGGRAVCYSPPRKGILPDSKHTTAPSFRQVVLEDGAMAVGSDGYLALSRQVVSVELRGRLEVRIYAYSQSRDIAAHSRVSIKAQNCNVTQHKCRLGDSELEITVAWSRLVQDKGFISNEVSVKL